jgi:hypothetical protein
MSAIHRACEKCGILHQYMHHATEMHNNIFLRSPYHGKCGILCLSNNNSMMPQKRGILPPSNLHDTKKMWHPTHIHCQFYICMMSKKCGILPPSNLHNAIKMRHPTPSNIKFICAQHHKSAASYSIQCQFYICMMPKKCGILPPSNLHNATKMRHPTPPNIKFILAQCRKNAASYPYPMSNLYLHDAAKMRHPTSNISA